MPDLDPGYDFAGGTYEEARAMIGTVTAPRTAAIPVNIGMIRQFASLVHDSNPDFWGEEIEATGLGAIAPPAMLLTWLMPLEWSPTSAEHQPLLSRIPLPGDTFINASHECEYFRSVRIGDVLDVTEELIDVSEEKTTTLGRGHFVTTAFTFRNDRRETVARATNVLFRFRR